MRIVHLANAYAATSGGIRTMAHELGRGYTQLGHDAVLVVPGASRDEKELPWGRRVTLPGLPVPGSGPYRALVDLAAVRRELDRLAPDRVEVSDRFTLRAVGDWARRAGIPSVVVAHERLDGVLHAHLRLPGRLAQTAADRHNAGTARRFDRVVTTSRFAAREFERIGAPTAHVPLGVDLDLFRPPSVPPRPGGAPPLLALCSRLSREKRPDVAVDAVEILTSHGCAVRLVVAGDGPLRPSLRRRSRGLPVTFVGHVQDRGDVARLLGEADVVLVPGPIETFGLAALEALACGTPVVAAETSAVAELVGDEGGRVAAPTGPAFADAVVRVLEHPGPHREKAARNRAEQFPWVRCVERMLAIHVGEAASPVPINDGTEVSA